MDAAWNLVNGQVPEPTPAWSSPRGTVASTRVPRGLRSPATSMRCRQTPSPTTYAPCASGSATSVRRGRSPAPRRRLDAAHRRTKRWWTCCAGRSATPTAFRAPERRSTRLLPPKSRESEGQNDGLDPWCFPSAPPRPPPRLTPVRAGAGTVKRRASTGAKPRRAKVRQGAPPTPEELRRRIDAFFSDPTVQAEQREMSRLIMRNFPWHRSPW